MNNLITYKEGYSNLSSNESWENTVKTGEGKSYGGELFLQKKKGQTTGWVGYTLSWTNRRFDDISFGEWFPYKYDRRHDLSFVLSHKFNDNFDIGLLMYMVRVIYYISTELIYWGQPYSNDWYDINIVDLVESYGSRNSTRMPSYQRFDIGLNKHWKTKKTIKTFSIGSYNLYNRKNPFFIYLDINEENERVVKQVSLFPIIPSISYRIKF